MCHQLLALWVYWLQSHLLIKADDPSPLTKVAFQVFQSKQGKAGRQDRPCSQLPGGLRCLCSAGLRPHKAALPTVRG